MVREFSATVVQRECQLRDVRSVARHAVRKLKWGGWFRLVIRCRPPRCVSGRGDNLTRMRCHFGRRTRQAWSECPTMDVDDLL